MAEHEHHHGDEHDDDPEHDELTEAEAQEQAERLVRKEIALSQIRQYGDPVLRMRADVVESFDAELRKVSERMIGLMHDADGIGLAATQVGILRRMFVCTLDGEDHVLVNPVVTSVGDETEVDVEGCLSLGSVRVPVERATRVSLAAQDIDGEPVALELEGLPARIVQHEADHLDGRLMLERSDAESRREALGRLRPRLVLTS
ncbi:MAG TPA: peptide deformylase [Gaiella sp.]|uniref:peptide deformylase n=1 Tax=Gaiella sp. TaxID=2663207 RepID=UPI002D8066E6|nr:peptide deformylase [Gaiella sp.]HET9287673.1 peptide deformylase [Gaiella sp.]